MSRAYSFRLSVRPYVFSYVRSFICTSVTFVEFASKVCVKVSQVVYMYLSNYFSESIYIWTIVTLEDWHSIYDQVPGPQGHRGQRWGEWSKSRTPLKVLFIAPAFSKVRYRGSTFRPFVRSFVRPSVRPQFASSLENLRRVWE